MFLSGRNTKETPMTDTNKRPKQPLFYFTLGIIVTLVVYFTFYLVFISPSKDTSNQLETEIQRISLLVENSPVVENYFILGLAYYNAGRFQESVEANKKILELEPNHAIAYNNLGASYNNLEMWDEAITALEKSLELEPEFELAQNNLLFAKRYGK